MGICCVNWQIVLLFLVVLVVFEGVSGRQVKHWNRGHATFYGQNQNPATLGGACGYDSTVHAGFGIHTTALSGVLFRKGEACGACYQVRCDYRADPKWCLQTGQVTVTATNFCPANNQGGWCDPPRQHFDMAMPSFLRIARPGNEGIVPILFKRVSCHRRGGVRFTLRGQGNFHMVMISNVGGSGDVKAAWVRISMAQKWVPMVRNWGVNWQSSSDLRNHVLSFKLTLVDGKTLTFLNVVPSSWRFGQTFSARNQFTY